MNDNASFDALNANGKRPIISRHSSTRTFNRHAAIKILENNSGPSDTNLQELLCKNNAELFYKAMPTLIRNECRPTRVILNLMEAAVIATNSKDTSDPSNRQCSPCHSKDFVMGLMGKMEHDTDHGTTFGPAKGFLTKVIDIFRNDKEVLLKVVYLDAILVYRKCPTKFSFDCDLQEAAQIGIRDYISWEKTSVSEVEQILQELPDKLRDDDQIFEAATEKKGSFLRYASSVVKNDEWTVQGIVEEAPESLPYASSDVQLILKVKDHYETEPETIILVFQKIISPELRDNKEFVLRIIRYVDGRLLQGVSERLKDDWEVALACVQGQNDTSKLEYATERARTAVEALVDENKFALLSQDMKDDKTYVLAAAKRTACVLRHVSERLRNDEIFMLKVATMNGEVIEYAGPALQQNTDFFFQATRYNIACKKNGGWKAPRSIWRYLPSYVKSCREMCLLLIDRFGHKVLPEAFPANMLADRDIVLKALGKPLRPDRYCGGHKSPYPDILDHASELLLQDLEFMMEAVRLRPLALDYASAHLKSNRELVRLAVKQDFNALQYASEVAKNDREIALVAIAQAGWGFKYISEELQDDKDLLFAAMESEPRCIAFASMRLQNNREMVLVAVRKDGGYLRYASDELADDKIVVLEALTRSATALKHASKRLRDDKDCVLKALSHDGRAIEYASEVLQNDRECVVEALRSPRMSCHQISDAFKEKILRPVIQVLASAGIVSGTSEDIRQVAQDKIRSPACKKIWLLGQVDISGKMVPALAVRAIAEYADLRNEFKTANMIDFAAPVLAILSGRNERWIDV